MFGIGMTELLVVLAIAVLVLGPKRLPELAHSLGKGLVELRRASREARREFLDASDGPETKAQGAAGRGASGPADGMEALEPSAPSDG